MKQKHLLKCIQKATACGPSLWKPDVVLSKLQQIFEALARLEKTSGLDLARLIAESADRLPRDATVIAILSKVTDVEVIALTALKQQGFAVSRDN